VFLRTAEKVTSEAEKSEMRRTVKEAIVVVLPFIHRFALSLCTHRPGEFFCVSPVTMFARVRGTSATPAPAADGLSQNQANAALVKALHNVANVKLRNAINKAKAAANATGAEKTNRIAELEKALVEAKPVVTAAANVAPNIPVANATLNAEAAAVNAVIKNIQNLSKPVNVNAIKASNAYQKNSKRINNALNSRKAAVNPFSN
jgi:hypothetical protein